MKERNFGDVYRKIVEIAPEELKEKLENRLCFAAPELVWSVLSRCVNNTIIPSSKDPLAIKIYAILCDCSDEEMKARFESDGI